MPAKAHHVLVVDDDTDLTRTVGDILRVHGYGSVLAKTGSEGLDILVNDPEPFPVALVDLRLPDMDGLDLVARLHEIASMTQVVILTGNASLDSAVGALRERSYDYLVKPVPPDQLITTVRQGLQRWNHQSAEEELRKDRERFKLLVEALSEVVTVISADLHVEYQSPSALHTLGYGPGVLAGTSFLDLVHPADQERVEHALERLRQAPGRDVPFEFRFQKSDGTWCLLEGLARSLHGQGGAPLVLTCRDITERRRLEAELRQSQKMESVGRLAGGVAHDFNNQLTAILSAVDLAGWQEGVSSSVREELGEIRTAAQRAARLTRQLLIFSRKDVAEPRRLALNQVVEGMRSMLRRLIPADIALVTDLAPSLPPILADPTQIEQVIVNLVVNARDAMADGGGRIVLKTTLRSSGDGAEVVVLEVEDDGEGMSDEVLARVFEPFFTTKEQSRGTGLGLATCYGIVTGSGGTIRARSTLGEGTVFEVALPSSPHAPESAPSGDRGGTATNRGGGETILLVEDDEAVRRVLAKILRTQGYDVITAASGHEALSRIRDSDVQLLLTDLVMPGMNGREVAESARAEKPGVRVLFTSGYADADVVQGGRLPFGAELLNKPVETHDLLRKVRKALDPTAA